MSQFIYVGSCGAYQKSDEVPLIEGDAVKSSAGQIAVESLLASSGLNYSAFRPIYIIGPKCSKKEYIDYFFHRIVRNRPVFFPASSKHRPLPLISSFLPPILPILRENRSH